MGVVYEIHNNINGYRYIGSAVNANRRKINHFSLLRTGKHHTRYLQNSFKKYGEMNFIFGILEDNIPQENLIEREQYWLDTLQPEYNTAKFAGRTTGITPSAETIAKRSIANTGQRRSQETRTRMSIAAMGNKNGVGQKISEEHRAKLKAANIGKKWALGYIPSDEHRAKISVSKMGYKHSDEARVKMSQSRKGRHLSDEHKANIGKGLLGHKLGERGRAILRIVNSKPVRQLNKITGEVIKEWESGTQAAKELGLIQASISSVCSGKRKTTGGFRWEFA
jgi:group I intron endonuclease